MTDANRTDANDPNRDLPYLLKASPVKGEQPTSDEASTTIGRTRNWNAVPPAPPAAGFNPYFDLPPDVDAVSPPVRTAR